MLLRNVMKVFHNSQSIPPRPSDEIAKFVAGMICDFISRCGKYEENEQMIVEY